MDKWDKLQKKWSGKKQISDHSKPQDDDLVHAEDFSRNLPNSKFVQDRKVAETADRIDRMNLNRESNEGKESNLSDDQIKALLQQVKNDIKRVFNDKISSESFVEKFSSSHMSQIVVKAVETYVLLLLLCVFSSQYHY